MPSMLTTFFFFFNDTATTEIYTLSLHDALPIYAAAAAEVAAALEKLGRRALAVKADVGSERDVRAMVDATRERFGRLEDRKSTRLNSSHDQISYAVFCLKKKKLLDINHTS